MPPVVHTPPYHHHRNNFPVLILRPVPACRTIYTNQSTIDGLNAILSGCDKLRIEGRVNCNPEFIRNVETELLRQLSIAVPIGRNCSNPTIY